MGNFGNRNMGFFSAGGSSGGGSGTVTSVGLSMPSAFSISGTNPITTSGTLAVTGAGLTSQYIRGDGTLANFPSSFGGGASVSYYLNGSVSQGTIGGSVYYQLSSTPVIGAGTNFTRTNAQGDGLIAQFITDANVPNQLNIPSGNWNFETYFSSSASGGSPAFYLEVYKYDGATFSLIATNSTNPDNISSGTTIDLYVSTVTIPTTSLALTDRIAVRVFVITGGRTITLHTEDQNVCQIITTFTTGLTALNGLTAQVQTFATGTSGTDFDISSSGSTHNFNLPTANATNRGALSSADWSIFTNGIVLTAYGLLGSSYKSASLSVFNPAMLSVNGLLADGSCRLCAVYVPIASTITGVRWFQGAQGDYTADNYNGVGLYRYSGGTLTLEASSTNDGNIWKGTANTWQTKAFSATYSASAGVYFIGALYNSSAQVTPPSIGSSANMLNAQVTSQDFTNSAKLVSAVNATSLPATQAMSGTANVNINYGFWLY